MRLCKRRASAASFPIRSNCAQRSRILAQVKPDTGICENDHRATNYCCLRSPQHGDQSMSYRSRALPAITYVIDKFTTVLGMVLFQFLTAPLFARFISSRYALEFTLVANILFWIVLLGLKKICQEPVVQKSDEAR